MLLQTSQGEITIDLHVDLAPRTCKNFLKLCKRARRRRPPAVPSPPPCRARARLPAHALCGGVPPPNPRVKYYNNCLFHNIQPAFIAQTGDPTGSGKGGDSVSGLLYAGQRGTHGPHLIVVPSSTLENWSRELARWGPLCE